MALRNLVKLEHEWRARVDLDVDDVLCEGLLFCRSPGFTLARHIDAGDLRKLGNACLEAAEAIEAAAERAKRGVAA